MYSVRLTPYVTQCVLVLLTDSAPVRSRPAAVLCYQRGGSQVPGARPDAGTCDGLHQAESSDKSLLDAQPVRPQCS